MGSKTQRTNPEIEKLCFDDKGMHITIRDGVRMEVLLFENLWYVQFESHFAPARADQAKQWEKELQCYLNSLIVL